MTNFIQRDKERRFVFRKQENKRLHHKSIINDLTLPTNIRAKHAIQLNKLNRNGALVRTRNRCVLTGRARAIETNFRISRIKFRDLVSKGNLLGVCKSSW